MERADRKRIYVVPVLMRTLDILELLSGSDSALNSNEISNAIDIPHTTTYRILQTLLLRGYINQNDRGKYSVRSCTPKDSVSARTSDGQGSSDLRLLDATARGGQTFEALNAVLQSLVHSNEGRFDCKI